MKWLSAFLSALIVGAFVGFYFWTYQGNAAYSKARDARLVASVALSLRAAVQADEPKSRVQRQEAKLTVSGLAEVGSADYTVDLAGVLAGVARPGDFAALLVSDDKGTVLAQHADVHLDGLRSMLAGGASGSDDKAKKAEEVEREAFAQRPTQRPMQFGEQRLLAFCHPATLPPSPAPSPSPSPKGKPAPAAAAQPPASPAPGGAGSAPANPEAQAEPAAGETLVLCGLVDEARLEREAAAVSPLALAALLAVLALTLLVPPFLKVQLLARPQRLRFADVFRVGACQALGLMIVAVACAGMALHYGLAGLADHELQAVAADVRQRLGQELKLIDAQVALSDALASVQGYRAGWGDTAPAGDQPSESQPRFVNDGLLANGACLPRQSASEPRTGCVVLPFFPYPFFETLAWIDARGQQRVKWWAETTATPAFFDVASRRYFSDARDGLVVRSAPGSNWPEACVVAALRVWSTGEVRAIYARPAAPAPQAPRTGTPPAPPAATLPAVVQALTTRLIALDAPVLPAGTGFVVIDPSGHVLFHSDGRLSQTHNLFEETAQHPRLRAAVVAHAGDTFSARYWGRWHSLHVEPLGPLPWTLVTFREHEWARAVSVEALSEALLLCLAFALVALALALVYYVARGRRTPFPWPDGSLTWLYAHLSMAFATVGALYAFGLGRTRGIEATALALTLPWATLLCVGLVLEGRRRLRRRWPDGPSHALSKTWRLITLAAAAALVAGVSWFARTPQGLLAGACTAAVLALAFVEGSRRVSRASERGFRLWHRAASTAFWLLFAVLPAVGLVKGAGERALAAHAARSLALFTQRLETRELAIQRRYAGTLRAVRRDLSWDVYTGTLHALEVRPAADPRCLALNTASADPARAAGGLARLERQLAAWKPYLAEHAVELRHVPAGDDSLPQGYSTCTGVGPKVEVRAAAPSFWRAVTRWGFGLPAVLLLPLLALAVWVSVWWAERVLFATDIACPARRSIPDVRRATLAGARLFALAPSSFERRDLASGDWHEPPGPADGEPGGDAGRPWLVRESDLLGGDAAARARALTALEDALTHGERALVIVGARPPAAWLTDLGQDPSRARWAEVLERFETVVAYAPFTDADENTLSEQLDGWLGANPGRGVRDALTAELRRSPYVLALCVERLAPRELDERDRHACLRRIEELASPYYRALWEACSPDERLTLLQVAEEGFVNPQRLDTLETLLAKGLVRRSPALEPMNESFELFVRRREQAEPLAKAEAAPADAGFGWAQLRAPLATLALVTAGFIFVTERRLFESASGLSTLLVGTVVPLLGEVAKLTRRLASAEAPSGGGGANA